MARELGPDNVRVNSITPGLIQTDITGDKLTDELRAEIIKGIPLARLGVVDDIGNACLFLAFTIVAFVILGSVLEGIPAIVLFGPLLFPIAKQVGVHEVHYAMVVILAMGIGLFAPPFGVGYYAACAISRIHPDEGMRPIVGYMIALLIGTIIIAAIPWLSIGFL